MKTIEHRTLIKIHFNIITKTCLYNFDPLKPHFYIVKLGFTGVNIIFLISAQNIGEAVLTSTHNLCFEQKYEKYQKILSENFQFLVVKFSIYLNRRVFVMLTQTAETDNCANNKIHMRRLIKIYIASHSALRKHAYSNIWKISPPKNWIFSDKKTLIFFKFLLKT